MRYALFIAVLVAGPVFAQDKPKPNTLSPKEIADGWVMLFDGESTFGWKIDGPAEVKDGWLVIGGDKPAVAKTTTRLADAAVQLEGEWQGTKPPLLLMLTDDRKDGVSTKSDWKPNTVDRHSIQNLGIKAVSTSVTVETPPGTTVRLRNVRAQSHGSQSLFNGKDLSGWKVFDGDAKKANSKFEVTKDGELKVTNGPGDLQTEKQFDNFVLQFECKTNGKGLNSGVFFRCIPGQYQNGYEAQVQNEFLDGDRTKPKDFGTGAIYRRVPARKVVSNDNEWFTMTLVADGNHFSTWVNGYQTVDWTDDRPANDNPRQGFKAGKGPLSIQGHDPTTDLLFRNLRIVELPPAKKQN